MKLTKRIMAAAVCAVMGMTSMVGMGASATNTTTNSYVNTVKTANDIVNILHTGTYINNNNANSNIQIISDRSAYLTNVEGYSGDTSIYFSVNDVIYTNDVGTKVGTFTIYNDSISAWGTYDIYLESKRISIFSPTVYYYVIHMGNDKYEQTILL